MPTVCVCVCVVCSRDCVSKYSSLKIEWITIPVFNKFPNTIKEQVIEYYGNVMGIQSKKRWSVLREPGKKWPVKWLLKDSKDFNN